jgi:hypothetical protein
MQPLQTDAQRFPDAPPGEEKRERVRVTMSEMRRGFIRSQSGRKAWEDAAQEEGEGGAGSRCWWSGAPRQRGQQRIGSGAQNIQDSEESTSFGGSDRFTINAAPSSFVGACETTLHESRSPAWMSLSAAGNT